VGSALRSLLERARCGERVEVGCHGGHGRTGTALACAAVLCGLPSGDAVPWVRVNYCVKAVESAQQEAFVFGFDG
jgi:protein-tyrosine phosphatase